MKRLVDTARAINDRSIEGTAIVKSQRRGDPVVGGAAPRGIYFEGGALPPELGEIIAESDGAPTIWRSDDTLKVFVPE